MDERFRKLQRAWGTSPDLESAGKYIHALEQRLGIRPETKVRVKPDDKTIPCLLCEKPLEREGATRMENDWIWGDEEGRCLENPCNAVSVSTDGNYGSQVLDLSGRAFFYICDGCLIRHSNKMFFIEDGSDEVQNARDYYEAWIKALRERNPSYDEYTNTVGAYFEP